MKTRIVLGTLLVLAAAAPGIAMARTSIQIGINVPAPVVVYHQEPRWVMVPDQRVYVVDDDQCDYDYFRYGGWYWIYENDNWYRARRYNGPFAVVRASYVPGPIWRLGDSDHYRWRHRPMGMPPGLAKKYRRGDMPPGQEHRQDRGDDRGRGHGRGHGHDRDDR